MNAIEITKIIKEIGKSKISFDAIFGTYLLNGASPSSMKKDYFAELYSKFRQLLYQQLADNSNSKLLEKLITLVLSILQEVSKQSDNYRVAYVFSKSKNELSDEGELNNEVIQSIFKNKSFYLNKIKEELDEINENLEFKITSDFVKKDKYDMDVNAQLINIPEPSKATFLLSKSDVVLFFFLLEKSGIIQFNSDVDRNRLIESCFKYTELRNNNQKGQKLDITECNRDISKLRLQDRKAKNKNKNAASKLINLIYDKLNDVAF